SICVHCGAGCNTFVNERYGELRRILNRYNGAVNGYFLCDRGRFGHRLTGAPERIRSALVASAETRVAECVGQEMALKLLGAALDSGATIGIGSPRASLESNFALRSMVGAERFYLGVSDTEGRLLLTMLDLMRK